jgi:glutamate decarboxylase
MFGLREEFSGGISQPGGSASNFSSVLIARHRAFPSVKSEGLQGYRPVMFTSSESHYSLEKAAQMCGLGSAGVRKVASDNEGRMIVEELRRSILDAREEGLHPFYVNATAGTTVRGAYDKIEEIADICEEFKLWLHVDGSLGGSAIFSRKHSWNLRGCERASSITINPHKMLGVPVTCSFLLGRDLRDFWTANSTNAEYLFHLGSQASSNKSLDTNAMYDLADLTPQCGRKGDALKLALGLVYYGRSGYEQYVDAAFEQAAHLASLVEKHPYLCLVGSSVPHSVQVCFYYLPAVFTRQDIQSSQNTAITAYISEELPHKGFMVDYAPGPKGKMLRVVVNGSTRANTAENLVDAITVLGHKYTREVLMDGGRHI